jgi:hypothetical protein
MCGKLSGRLLVLGTSWHLFAWMRWLVSELRARARRRHVGANRDVPPVRAKKMSWCSWRADLTACSGTSSTRAVSRAVRLMGRTSADWTAWRSPKFVVGTRQTQIAERVPDSPLSSSVRRAATLQAMVMTSHGHWRAREASDPAAASCDSSSRSLPHFRP